MPPRFGRHWHRFDLADYEWSPSKNLANLAKHGLDFPMAVRIFESEFLRRRDTRISDETVFQAIGGAISRTSGVGGTGVPFRLARRRRPVHVWRDNLNPDPWSPENGGVS